MQRDREVLTVAQVAEKLQCSEGTVRTLIKSGKLRVVRLGGKGSAVRITSKALEEFLEGDPE